MPKTIHTLVLCREFYIQRKSMTKLIATNNSHKGNNSKPTPRINLSSLEHIRLEASRVFREARCGVITTQDASRLIYSLTSISKMIEAEETQQQLRELTIVPEKPTSLIWGMDLAILTEEQLDVLEIAVKIAEAIKEGTPLPEPPPELRAYGLNIQLKTVD